MKLTINNEASNKLKNFLDEKLRDIEIIGPAPSPVSRVRGFYRWNVLLKGKNRSIMCEALGKALKNYRKPSGTFLVIDVDTMSA